MPVSKWVECIISWFVRLMVGKPIARRWIYVILMSVCFFIPMVIFHLQILLVSETFEHFSHAWSPLLIFACTTLVSGLGGAVVFRLGGIHPNHRMMTMFRYPPVWVVSIGVVVAFFIYITTHYELFYDGYLIIELFKSISAISLGLVIALLAEYIQSKRSERSTVSTILNGQIVPAPAAIDDNQFFRTWILREEPIQLPADDLFDHTILARRMARLLLGKETVSIALLGFYGSGKTGILNLTYRFLQDRRNLAPAPNNASQLFMGDLITVRVDGWGRGDGAIAKTILALAVEKVRHYVDCAAVISLPENYRQAIAGTQTVGGAVLAALFQTSYDPLIQLAKLDDILSATNMRLIIFLEDVDRNHDNAIIKNQMPALLDRLRALRNISFVISIGPSDVESLDVARICDYRVAVP